MEEYLTQSGRKIIKETIKWRARMTPTELIEMAERGERIPRQPYSLHDEEIYGPCSHERGWRTIVCNKEKDVCECPLCGRQRIMRCNFDEEYT